MTLGFEHARECVLREITALGATEQVPLPESVGRVLAEPIVSDRDYPPFPRSARDGYAVRAADLPGSLRVIGEVRAGEVFGRTVGQNEAVEIMTGAPVPEGADAVVMIEHTTIEHAPDHTPVGHTERAGDRVRIAKSLQPGENSNARGSEAHQGDVLLRPGNRVGFAEVALLAMTGRQCVSAYRRPRVAILPTGDELVDLSTEPLEFQIRDTNSWSLAAQVHRAGGVPVRLPIARDNYQSTRDLIARGLTSDLLLLSGGVSAGKYDIVEQALADLGAKFFFDRVLIQPGQPLVFGAIAREEGGAGGDKFFFGLPGNPASTMVTFELFVRAAIDRLSGAAEAPLPFLHAALTRDFRHKTGLTRFLPARLSEDGATLTPEPWRGSGDIPALARSNAFLVADADRETWKAGDQIRVLRK